MPESFKQSRAKNISDAAAASDCIAVPAPATTWQSLLYMKMVQLLFALRRENPRLGKLDISRTHKSGPVETGFYQLKNLQQEETNLTIAPQKYRFEFATLFPQVTTSAHCAQTIFFFLWC